MYDCIIIGTGPAGLSAALNLKTYKKNFLWFGNKNFSDKVSKAEKITNYPGFPSISGEELMERFKVHQESAQLVITEKTVTNIMPMETEEERYFMVLADNEIYETRTLILAMGVMAAKLLEGEEAFLGRGVSYCATCDGKLYQGKKIAVLCSSKHYEQEVEYLAGLAEKVYYFPTFASTLTGENIVISKDLPVQVNGGMKVSTLTLRSGEQLEIDGLFCLRNAIAPTALLSGLSVEEGHIVVDRSMATNLPGCYAAGDCTGRPYQYTKAVGEGNVAAHSVISYLAAKKGEESFPVGSSKTFLFGKRGNVKADCYYNGENWGFRKPEHIILQEEEEMVSATNYRSCGTEDVTYEYPTFCGRVPVGIYEIKVVQGTNGKEAAVNGFYFNGWKYAGRWSREAFSVNFTEPSEESRIYTPAGEEKATTVTVAAPSGELVIELASWLDNEGRSGKTYVKEITVTRKPRILEPSGRPTLRFIGDSTLAKYPPEDGGVWVDIPERTGWGEDFSMGRFMDPEVLLVNKAVAGSSLKSYTGDGYWNDFLLESHPGDTVIIESGINDSAVGRRFSDADTFERLLEERIKGCLSFGLKVIVSSGTSSGREYTERMEKLADKYQLPYVTLLEQWEEYLLKLGITRADVTVDGTHLNRIGGVAAAQIVANAVAGIEGLSISGHVRPLPLNEACPDIRVEGLQVKRQAPGSITLKWEIEEEKLYQPKEFITGFQVYCTDGESPVLCGSRSAYVAAGMEHPCLEVTLEAEETKPHSYYVTCKGLTGEGPASETVTAKPYVPAEKELLETAIRKYSTALYDPFLYTEAFWEKLQEALTFGRKAMLSGTDKQKEALQAIEEAAAKLSRTAEAVEQNDFQKESLQGIPWQIEGKHQTLVSCQMNEEGNRYLKLYVEAAGPRYAWKHFEKAEEINASQILITFEWYPGQPDLRNCVELEFMRGEKDRLLSLKTSSNGHIGCVAGNYLEDNRYLVGDGFHPYEGSQAVDLFLSNRAWYHMQILFDFEAGEAVVSATLLPYRKGEEGLFTETENKNNGCLKVEESNGGRNAEPAAQSGKEEALATEEGQKETAKVCRVKLPEGPGRVTDLNFLMKRGRTDGDAANDMAILWCTCLDDFAYYYK